MLSVCSLAASGVRAEPYPEMLHGKAMFWFGGPNEMIIRRIDLGRQALSAQ